MPVTAHSPQRWVMYACRTAYATEVAEILWRCGDEIGVLVDNLEDAEQRQSELGLIIRPQQLTAEHSSSRVVVPLTTPGHRYAVVHEMHGLGLVNTPALVDPTAVVARTSLVGEGTVINAAAVIGASSIIGRFVHINRSASVGHDAHLHDFSTLGPACVLAGHVTVCSGAFVGAGAICGPKVTIGANSVVGAGAVVVRDVPEFAVVVGNPARIIRIGDRGYGDSSVLLS